METVCFSTAETCRLTWNGIAAVGTMLAVFAALLATSMEAVRTRADKDARSTWLRLELIHPLRDWKIGLAGLERRIEKSQFVLVQRAISKENGRLNPLEVPPSISASVNLLHELGPSGVPLAAAVFRAREFARTSWMIDMALRDYFDSDDQTERDALANEVRDFLPEIVELRALVRSAFAELDSPFGRKHPAPVFQRAWDALKRILKK
ncbi:hypothetical protein V3391_06755 [Luteimonas sp. SMYT11W]|uniref:Uncharacterized protein n=1 Tax=Luteimonas flava TaxID=3115822 RepID=A0ABU7WD55_9GAMM